MEIRILYFAGLRESLGRPGETLTLPGSVRTAGELRDWLCARGGVCAEQLAVQRAVRVAVDRQMADAGTGLREGAEVAFFPPVTGG
jgi:sulfur-carrier protein